MAQFLYKLKNKKGQGMIEMALILPVIVLCIGIIITSGQLIFAKLTCQIAAYEGARTAVVTRNYNTAKSAGTRKSKDIMKNAIGVDQSSVGVSFGSSAANWKRPNHLTYTVSANVKTLFPVITSDFTFSGTTPVSGTMVMMIERN